MSALGSRNVHTVRAIYAAFGRGDIDKVLARLRSDVRWEHNWQHQPPDSHRRRSGHDEVREFFAALQGFEMLRFEPLDFLASERRVAVPIAAEMRSKAKGGKLSDIELHLWEFDDQGAVVSHRSYVDSLALARLEGD